MKPSYKIPTTLDKSYMDMELAIQSKDGIGAKPLPIRNILSYVASVILLFYAVAKTFIGKGNPLQIGLFIIMWAAITVLLVKTDKTKRMNAMLLPVVATYYPNKELVTRTSQPANAFRRMTNIEDIDDNGLVTFVDGTVGYWYRVVGTASVLLFDEDKELIINRVESFYRKIGIDCEIIFITTKEAQKVYNQVANLKRRYDALDVQDDDLRNIANEQLHTLTDYVGTSFKSIHQYLVIKGDNLEALIANKNVVQSEVENSSLMIKQCVELYRDDIDSVLASIYK